MLALLLSVRLKQDDRTLEKTWRAGGQKYKPGGCLVHGPQFVHFSEKESKGKFFTKEVSIKY
jgi:hypothetical protein